MRAVYDETYWPPTPMEKTVTILATSDEIVGSHGDKLPQPTFWTYRCDGLTDNINDWRGEFRYANGLKMIYMDATERTDENDGCAFKGDAAQVHVSRYGIWAEPKSLLTVKLKPSDVHLHVSKEHHENFINSVKTRKDPVSDVESGHKASLLGTLAETSVRLKRTLKWDPVKESFPGDDEANNFLKRHMRSPWQL